MSWKYLILFLISISMISTSIFSQDDDDDLDELQRQKSSLSQQMDLINKIGGGPDGKEIDREALQKAIKGVQKSKKGTRNSDSASQDADAKLNDVMGMLTKMGGKGGKPMMALNPFMGMNEKQIKITIHQQYPKASPFLKSHPKVMTFMVKIFQDKKAIPNLMTIVADQKKMKFYGGLVMGIFVTAIILNLVMGGKNSTRLSRLRNKVLLSFFVLIAQLTSFLVIFSKEIKPITSIFKDVFL